MLETFLDVYPRLGVPTQITWYPTAEGVASYSIGFARPVHEDDVNAVRQFATQHGNITGATRHPRFNTDIVVVCGHGDNDHSLLAWLQQRFRPYRPYTGMVQVYTLLRPLMVRIGIMGVKPHDYDYERIVEALQTFPEVADAIHPEGTNEIIVAVGNVPADADPHEAVGFLTAQKYMGLTFLLDRETTAMNFSGLPKSE